MECSTKWSVFLDSAQFLSGVYDWILENDGYGFICRGVRAFQTYHQFLAEQASFTEKQVTALGKLIECEIIGESGKGLKFQPIRSEEALFPGF